jgi:hypothetical protein
MSQRPARKRSSPSSSIWEAETGKLLPWPCGYRQSLFDAAQWTQAAPVHAAKGKEWVVAWDTDMQALRDLPGTCP